MEKFLGALEGIRLAFAIAVFTAAAIFFPEETWPGLLFGGSAVFNGIYAAISILPE